MVATKTAMKKTRAPKKAKENPEALAKGMFEAAGKEAYYLRDTAIRNLEELKDNLHEFTENEAHWVADWIEYLGDGATAKKIRKAPGDFKKIIVKRYEELKKHVKK